MASLGPDDVDKGPDLAELFDDRRVLRFAAPLVVQQHSHRFPRVFVDLRRGLRLR
jgi:hypothetical protein